MGKVSEFYEALSKDEAMQERAKTLDSAKEAAGKAVSEAIVAFAKDEGYTFTAEELNDFVNSNQLSDEELKAVTGGKERAPHYILCIQLGNGMFI